MERRSQIYPTAIARTLLPSKAGQSTANLVARQSTSGMGKEGAQPIMQSVKGDVIAI
jgi:hypothetical protein